MIMLSLLCLLTQSAGAPAKRATPAPPLARKGLLAWANAHSLPASSRTSARANRLHVHAVGDGTNVTYIREVKALLDQARKERMAFATNGDRDRALADNLSDLCYLHQSGYNKGSNVFSGFFHLFFRSTRGLCQKRRAPWLRGVASPPTEKGGRLRPPPPSRR